MLNHKHLPKQPCEQCTLTTHEYRKHVTHAHTHDVNTSVAATTCGFYKVQGLTLLRELGPALPWQPGSVLSHTGQPG